MVSPHGHVLGGERQAGGDQGKRLATLIADSAAGRRIGQLDRPARPLAPGRRGP